MQYGSTIKNCTVVLIAEYTTVRDAAFIYSTIPYTKFQNVVYLN